MTEPRDTSGHARVTSDDLPDVVTAQQAAELLQLSTKTLKRLAQAKDVPSRRVGNQWRFNRHALMNWLAGNDENTDPPPSRLTQLHRAHRRDATAASDAQGTAQ
jgi:excisionase family DNA binding protein